MFFWGWIFKWADCILSWAKSINGVLSYTCQGKQIEIQKNKLYHFCRHINSYHRQSRLIYNPFVNWLFLICIFFCFILFESLNSQLCVIFAYLCLFWWEYFWEDLEMFSYDWHCSIHPFFVIAIHIQISVWIYGIEKKSNLVQTM